MADETPKPTTIATEDIFARILDRSGLTADDFNMLALPDHAIWFPWGFDEEKRPSRVPSLLKLSEPLPVAPAFAIFSLFHGEDEIRVYALWNIKDKPPAAIKTPFRRYVFSKTAPTYFCENMLPDLFVEAIANEWMDIAETRETAEEAREAMVEEFQEYVLRLIGGAGAFPNEQAVLQRIYDDLESGAWQPDEDPEPSPDPDPNHKGSVAENADPGAPNEAPKPN